MKRVICFILVICCISALLCSCGNSKDSEEKKISAAELDGVWETVEKLDGVSELKTKLLNNGFFEKELALMDSSKLCAVKTLTFTSQSTDGGTYAYCYDMEATYVYLTVFVEDLLTKIYDNIAEMSDDYGAQTLSGITSYDEFKTFYCANFQCASYDELIDKLCGLIFNSSMYDGSFDDGKFTVDGNMINMTQTLEADYVSLDETASDSKPEQVGASIKDGKLILSYKSGTETYTKR